MYKKALQVLKQGSEALLSLAFPKLCAACNVALMQDEDIVCLACKYALPQTNLHTIKGNIIEQVFWGRVPIQFAASFLYFDKLSKVQEIIHQLKYNNQAEIGIELGKWYATILKNSNTLPKIDAIIPVPLHYSRLKKRGYNQSEMFANGLSEILEKPVFTKVLTRNRKTETQTKKSRFVRWHNVNEAFILTQPKALQNKHILLVDDVLTTGATLESCAQAILMAENIKISILTIATARH